MKQPGCNWRDLFDFKKFCRPDLSDRRGRDVESLCETPAMANMMVETPLSHMYALARGWDMAPEDCDDPC